MNSAEPLVRHWYGLSLALLTAAMWGTLPIALQLLLKTMDAVTITWARFLFSALFVLYMLQRKAKLPKVSAFTNPARILTAIAILALVGNFILYLIGLELLNPETSGVIIQLAPFILMFGSVIFYGERMSPLDIVAALILFSGLGLFFNDRLEQLFQSMSDYTLGVVAMLAAAVSWSVYGLLQKTLLRSMSSMQLTLLIYAGGAILLLLPSDLPSILELDLLHGFLLLFCCMNMVLGYGAFTEAMHVWQAAKVSAVIALAPVITIVCMPLAVWLWPEYYESSGLNLLSYVGAGLVVTGSMVSSLNKRST